MGPPANLPSFEHLAVQIAGGALARRPTEPLDAYLGRVERHGINVQARARQFIDVQHDTGELFDLAAGALAGGADRDDVRRIAAEMLRLGLVDGESLRRMTDERQDGD